jgi:dTDP-4-dehydrorhamnose 3,5-epimerase
MKLFDTSIAGVMRIERDSREDERGAFARLFCAEELKELLGARTVVQINHSMTRSVGAIRGLHYQVQPYAEMKIVRCIKGRVFDVAVDLRRDSATFLKWNALELTPQSHQAYVIPEGCAHGFQVLEEHSELLYLHTEFYTPKAEAALRFDDPRIAVQWPLAPTDLSARDLSHPVLLEHFKGIWL